jgi:hypothetical protein
MAIPLQFHRDGTFRLDISFANYQSFGSTQDFNTPGLCPRDDDQYSDGVDLHHFDRLHGLALNALWVFLRAGNF